MDRPGLARRAGGRHRGGRQTIFNARKQLSSLPPFVCPSVVRSLGCASACLPSSSVAEVQRAADERSADRRVSYLRVALVAEDDTAVAAAGWPLSAGEEAANCSILSRPIYFEGGMSDQSEGRKRQGARGRRERGEETGRRPLNSPILKE